MSAASTAVVKRSFTRRALPYFSAAFAGSWVVYGNYTTDWTLEGPRRGIYFWSKVGPLFMRYNWRVFVTKEPVLDLHESGADLALQMIHNLGGFYIKCGQYVSGRPELLPKSYLRKFQQLQDKVPSRPVEEIKATIEAELGQPIDEVFSEFDTKPLGVASIGQVHRARLKEDGQQVCVKVQYEEVERQFFVDLHCIKTVVGTIDRASLSVLDELRDSFLLEFDYNREARNLKEVGENMSKAPFASKVAVPKPIFSRRKVLVMEWLQGRKLDTALKADVEKLTGHKLGEEDDLKMMAQKMMNSQEGGSSSSTNNGFGTEAVKQIKTPWWGSYINFTTAIKGWRLYMWLLSWWKTPLETNDEILNILFKVHGHQIFHDGFFQADAHPGNFLLLDDGRIGLIDYGQTKRLDIEQRKKLAFAIKAIAEDVDAGNLHKDTEICRASDRFGIITEKDDPLFKTVFGYLLFGSLRQVERIAAVESGQAQCMWKLKNFFMDLHSRDKVLYIPGDLYLPARTATLLRGMGLLLGRTMSPAEAWAPYAKEFLKEYDTE